VYFNMIVQHTQHTSNKIAGNNNNNDKIIIIIN